MKRNWMFTLATSSAAVVVWLSVCLADAATAEPSKTPDAGVGTKCCAERCKAKCCPAREKGKCCREAGKAKCCPAECKGTGCADNDRSKCRPAGGKAPRCRPPEVAKVVERLRKIGYSDEDIARLPASVTCASRGCSNPVAFAEIKEGDTVLDLGSGAGIDCFLAVKRVGTGGKVIGVDMSSKAIAAAEENKRKIGAGNVEFRKGRLEKMPVEDESVDVAISNCVGCVMRGDDAVIREAFRVLKPGGRLALAAGPDLDPKLRAAGFEVVRSEKFVKATKPSAAETVKQSREERHAKETTESTPSSAPSEAAEAVQWLERIGFGKQQIAELPELVKRAGARSGNPAAFADLKEGDTVVDLGCGAGVDCLLAAGRVGSSGKVIGVDMSPKAIAAAEENKRKIGADNVEFRKGRLEKMPLDDKSVDVAISNCVVPVMQGKAVILREVLRVLKPGGQLVFNTCPPRDDAPADVLPGEDRETAYLTKLRAAGFAKVEVGARIPPPDPIRSKLMVVARKAGQVAGIGANSRAVFSTSVTLPSSDVDRETGPCPVDGKAIKKHLSLDIVGLRLYACSEQCLERMRELSFVRVELGKKRYVPEQVPVNRSRPRTSEQILKDMVLVDGGDYVRLGNYYLYREEKPRQGDRYTVRIGSFYIDKCEVTVEEYCTFLNDGNEEYWNPWYPKIKRNESGRFVPAGPDVAKMPVGGVNYYQAKGYAQWAGKRLPTEAEWEYAAGGQEGRKYPWGNEEPDKTRTGFGGPIKPVGSFPKGATPEGVLDLLGNVTEWCADFYSEDYYRKAPPGNLLEDPQGPQSGYYRMTRGGCTGMKMVVATRHQRPPLLSAG